MTEEEIIEGICKGGRALDAAVKVLYQNMAQPMLRHFIHLGVSGDEAKDILQDTFVKIVGAAPSFSGTGKASSWMWQIARNSALDFLDRRSRLGKHEVAVNDDQWQMLSETTAASEPSRAIGSIDECVSAGLLKFAKDSPERALALSLQMEGESIGEIGKRIGRSVVATKEYLSQCRKKIKPYIEHCRPLLST